MRLPGTGITMSASFSKRLKREFSANPKKAAALSGLLLVAIWFWAPLVKGWLMPESKLAVAPSPAAAPPPGPGLASSPNAAAPPSGSPSPPRPTASAAPTGGAAGAASFQGASWQQVAQAIESDERMQPSLATIQRADIFITTAPTRREPAESDNEKPAEPIVEITPASAGIVLSSTIVGGGRQVAQINGKRYSVGDELKTEQDGHEVVFKLIAIEPKRVVLEYAGARFVVKLPSAKLAGTRP
jgi:hypothetical protein